MVLEHALEADVAHLGEAAQEHLDDQQEEPQ